MKTFRLIDLVIQLSLVLLGILSGFKSLFGTPVFFLYFYFIVGGWQICSMLTHYFLFTATSLHHLRTYYAKICLVLLIISLVLGILYSLIPETIFLIVLYGYALLWGTPFLAFFYFAICLKEYKLMIKKELIHLK